MSSSAKDIHDRMLAAKPEDADHDPLLCFYCAASEDPNKPSDKGGPSMGDFTQEQVDALIADAVGAKTGDLQAQLDKLLAAQAETEVGQAVANAVAEATKPLQEQVDELTTKLDAAEAKATTAEAELAERKEADEAAEKLAAEASRWEAREKVIADLKVFTPEQLEEKRDRLSALSDEDWDERVEEWTAIAAAHPGKGKPTTPPPTTAFQASRQSTEDEPSNNLHLIASLRQGTVAEKAS